MGNSLPGGPLHNEARKAALKFDTDEIHVLRKTWQDLADRSDGKGIDKDTFLQYFPLNGLLGERLFAQFDTKNMGRITFDDFITGLAKVCRGTMDDKIHFIFNMYDVSRDNTVSKQDLTTLLNHIPKYAFAATNDYHLSQRDSFSMQSHMQQQQYHYGGGDGGSLASTPGPPELHRSTSIDGGMGHNSYNYSAAGGAEQGYHGGIGERGFSEHENGGIAMDPSYEEDVDVYTNHDMVERAFAECDLNHEGRLSYEEFKMWVQRNPSVMEYIESILPYNGPKDLQPHHHKKETLPHMRRVTSRAGLGGRSNSLQDLAGDIFNHSTNSHVSRRLSISAHRLSSADKPLTPLGSVQHLNQFSASAHNNNNGDGAHSPAPTTPMSQYGMNLSRNSSFGVNHSSAAAASGPASTSTSGADASAATAAAGPPSDSSSVAGIAAVYDNGSTPPTLQMPGDTAGTPVAASAAGDFGNFHALDTSHNNNNGSAFNPCAQNSPAVGSMTRKNVLEHQSSTGSCSSAVIRAARSPSAAGGESVLDGEEMARTYLLYALESTQNEALRSGICQLLDQHTLGGMPFIHAQPKDSEIYQTLVTMEAYLWKKGKSIFHMLGKRYYLLSGNCMYYYLHKNDVRPKGVIFLTGSIIERTSGEDMELRGYYGFEIMYQDLCTGEHHRHEKRVLYCKSESEREKWVSALQHAAHVVPIEDDYVIGMELGRGRFSVVCECVHKVTGEHCAVKIIDKGTIEPEEKGLLRTEIAVLKLVNHPNIIRMEGLYESKQHIYIVMEMLKGGELFERIVGRPRFTEAEAAKLLRPLLESVAYLHDLGIVHRDLKPENILCGAELEDLKIADFGLSKMILPKEKMDSACGTLSYVAPEVLTMQGYGKEADLWSVGVIMFLLMCGKLPFDGDDHNEIIRSTIQADLKVNPAVWAKLSEESKSLMTALLNKNPKERITARDALRHPFILTYCPHHSHQRRQSHTLSSAPGMIGVAFDAAHGRQRSASRDSNNSSHYDGTNSSLDGSVQQPQQQPQSQQQPQQQGGTAAGDSQQQLPAPKREQLVR